jgi:hypothetical protein
MVVPYLASIPSDAAMRTLLICHADAPLFRHGISRWLASFSDLAGIVLLEERRQRLFKRIKNEIRRVGFFRLFDVFAFRLYYKLFLTNRDRIWEQEMLRELEKKYPDIPSDTPMLATHSPNTKEAEQFIRGLKPDLMVVFCKRILKKRIFSIPPDGTFVMHPGICPKYRNAHGCFWALANNDLDNVGMTLLKIDEGIDTGPVFGYFTCNYDELRESHIRIQYRVIFDNLEEIKDTLLAIHDGKASTIDTTGQESNVWGHPWLSSYMRWKISARRRNR